MAGLSAAATAAGEYLYVATIRRYYDGCGKGGIEQIDHAIVHGDEAIIEWSML
ncbi:MAG: hypothetical protein GKR94_07775 [Gammaproteobacteria bacterium]|nr:hypothetical protein [Gammaproteobacteria bacterium]